MNGNSTGVFDFIRETKKGEAFLVTSISVGLLAQFALTKAKETPALWEVRNWFSGLGDGTSPLLGLILYALAGILFIDAIKYTNLKQIDLKILDVGQKLYPPRFGFWFTSLGLSILIALYSYQSTPSSNALGLEIAALISSYLFTISLYFEEKWALPTFRKVVSWFVVNKIELMVITSIVVSAFVIRFVDLEMHPYSFINDEGEMGRRGACLIQDKCQGLMDIEWSQQTMLAFLPTGLSVAFLGNTVIAVRLVSVILGTLAVLAVYLFAREIFGVKIAVLSAALLATLPLHVHFSRLGVDNIMDSLSATILLWLLLKGLKTNSTPCFLIAGFIAGLCFYTYPGSRLAPFIGLAAIFLVGMNTRNFVRTYARQILIFLLATFIISAPILGFFISHPKNFSARMDTVGLFGNGILTGEMRSKGYGVLQVLGLQFMKSTLVYIVTGAPTNFFNSPDPYLVPLAAFFFVMGLSFAFWRIKDYRFSLLLIWFWIVVIFGSTLTGGPPTSQRILMSTPPLVILVAIGVTKASEMIPFRCRFARLYPYIILFLFTFWISYQNVTFYFGEYRNGHYFEDPTNEFTYETRTLIAPLHTSGILYLLTDPGIPYLSFANPDYFAPDVAKHYLNNIDFPTLVSLPAEKDLLFIASPARRSDLEYVAQVLPGGNWQSFNRRFQTDQLLFYCYKVEKHLSDNIQK